MHRFVVTLAVLIFTALPAAAEVHFDLSPQLLGNKIAINGVTHASTENPFTETDTSPNAYRYFTPDLYVFGYELGEDPLFPTSAEDPGINNETGSYLDESAATVNLTGTGLPLGSTLALTVTSDLTSWTGSGFATVPDQETIALTYGSTRTVGTGTGTLSPLLIKTFTNDDDIHLHLEAELLGNGGASTDPTAGIYLFSAVLQSSDPGIAASDPFYVVYNFGLDEADHAASIEWVQANLVPEPGSAALCLCSMIVLAARRRTRC
ncbi:MAG: hypothetical protein IT445_01360 [Phycisphaeraceae bacterium]|nr:hypothetical protein [Phycisphaeraceae bacterium]